MIGIFGTSDVENYGDLLYPRIFEHLLSRSGVSSSVRAFGFMATTAPAGAGYTTHAISALLHAARRTVDALCIGGGDILRTDYRTMASHYVRHHGTAPNRRSRWWPWKKPPTDDQLADEFLSRHTNFASVGPLVLDASVHAMASPMAYWSCGVPFDIDPAARIALSAAMDSAAYVYVRDSQSAAKLLRAGVKKPLHVAPDAIVTLSDRHAMPSVKAAGKRILANHGIDVTRRVLRFQAVSLDPAAITEVAAQLACYGHNTGEEVALIPIGHCHGDHHTLAELAKVCPGTVKLIPVRQIDDILAAIVACDAFVGTSLHGNITSFSYGIPHLTGPLAVDKLQGFIDVVGLDAEVLLTDWSQLHERLRWLRAQPLSRLSRRVERAKAEVYRTFAEMLTHLGLPGRAA